MTTYYALYILIFLSAWVLKRIGQKETYNGRAALCFFLLVGTVLALRHPSMGVDLGYGENFGYVAKIIFFRRVCQRSRPSLPLP